MASQHKASLRRIVQSSLANKKAADEILEALAEIQAQMNALLAKLDADAGVTDTDYEATLAVDELELD
jgi:hypothetical protein